MPEDTMLAADNTPEAGEDVFNDLEVQGPEEDDGALLGGETPAEPTPAGAVAPPAVATPPVATPPTPPAVPPVATPPAVVPPQQAQPPLAAAAPVPGVQTPPVPPAAVPAAAEAPGVPQELTPEVIRQRRTDLVGQLTNKYAVTPEQREQLLTDPDKVLPSMAANIIVDTYDMVMGTMMRQLPTLVGALQEQEKRISTTEQKFFGRWPSLNKPEYAETIKSMARAYRQVNPKISTERLIEEVGAGVHIALRIPLEPQVATPPPAGAQPPAVAAPAPRPLPHMPMAPGGSAGRVVHHGQGAFDDLLLPDSDND